MAAKKESFYLLRQAYRSAQRAQREGSFKEQLRELKAAATTLRIAIETEKSSSRETKPHAN